MTDPRDSDAALLAKSGRRAEAELLARPGAVSDATIIKIERIGPDERDAEAADRRLVG